MKERQSVKNKESARDRKHYIRRADSGNSAYDGNRRRWYVAYQVI